MGPSPAATSATGAVPAPPPSDAAPRPLAADELARARAELHAHYRARFGRLELRALAADASIDLDELAEPLDAMHVEASGAPAPTWHPISMAAGTSHFDVVGGDRPGVVRMLAQPAPLLTLLERPHARPCVVIGTAGSGKSLFLHRCAIAGSGGDRFLGIDRAIPVHVALAVARAAPQRSLADHAIASLRAAGLAIADAIDAEATAGRVVFLLDGLDEVGPAVQAVARAITALAATYPAARIVVTSRPAGLAGIDLAADHLQLEGLDDDAIGRLLARWCELDERRLAPDDPAAGERGKADGLRLAARVFATPHLHDLAACPLLATYLAVLHRAGAPLPDRRIELYDRIGQLVVARWNQVRPRAERGTPPIGSADVIRLLGPVAFAI
ncbi:MAG TPA: NACHT domain-containing protein, partial [Kofleriaceae bacterium]|nr:NACHT domain-containing protein [Kofleriaceae bacterium]